MREELSAEAIQLEEAKKKLLHLCEHGSSKAAKAAVRWVLVGKAHCHLESV
jgi:hypothetical protein